MGTEKEKAGNEQPDSEEFIYLLLYCLIRYHLAHANFIVTIRPHFSKNDSNISTPVVRIFTTKKFRLLIDKMNILRIYSKKWNSIQELRLSIFGTHIGFNMVEK
jgi:hypothetical protein